MALHNPGESAALMPVDHADTASRISATGQAALLDVSPRLDSCQPELMRDTQASIAEWMREMMEKHGLSPTAWANKAGVGRDTVYRAIKPGYRFITSNSSLEKLARAVGEAPPALSSVKSAPVPSAEALGAILRALQDEAARHGDAGQFAMDRIAEALRDTLELLADEPSASDDPHAARLLARLAARRRLS